MAGIFPSESPTVTVNEYMLVRYQTSKRPSVILSCGECLFKSIEIFLIPKTRSDSPSLTSLPILFTKPWQKSFCCHL